MLIAQNRGAGQNMGFPDVCNTPVGPATAPIPYPNIGMNAQASSFAIKVTIKGMNALNLASQIAMTNGDEAGVAHWTFMGTGMYTMGNMKTFFEGVPGVTLTSMAMGNKGNCPLALAAVPSVSNVFLTQRAAVTSLPRTFEGPARERHGRVTDPVDIELQRHAGGVASVRIPAFARNVPSRLFTLLRQPPPSLVLDLRGNPGGDLDVMLEVADDFLPRGAHLMTMRLGDGDDDIRRARHEQRHRMPVAIVVDSRTASAAEVFAGILSSQGRAVVIGTRTYGKSSVQRFNPLPGERGSVLADVGRCVLPRGGRIPVEPTRPGTVADAIAAMRR